MSATGREMAMSTPGDVLEVHALDGVARAEAEHLLAHGLETCAHPLIVPMVAPGDTLARRCRSTSRAEPGDYAEACLLPGDPLRAKYIAETYFDEPRRSTASAGLLGYTGTWEGKPISVQGTGMGCPGATIVFEELIQLGVTRLLRVGTCGGLQPTTRSAT